MIKILVNYTSHDQQYIMTKIPYVLELTIPLCPPRLNTVLRMHRYARNDLFKNYYFLIGNMVKDRKPYAPLDKCHITIIRHHYRFLDWDNCVASFKPFVDSLTMRHSGIIKDDNYEVTGPWTVLQEFRAKKDGELTFIKIEGMQEAPPETEEGSVYEGLEDQGSEEELEYR